jgi:ubiquinone/menaquinone biosynthesis C-methylase UbiE
MGILATLSSRSEFEAFFYDLVVASSVGALHDALVEGFFTDLPAGCRVLDVGCGSGPVARRIAGRNPQVEVVGVDRSPGQIERAVRRGVGTPNLRFERGDAMALAFPDGAFDIVLSVASIKYWPDAARGLSEMARVCREGGTVWINELDADCTEAETTDFVARWKLVPARMRPRMARQFRKFVQKQGLRTAEIERLLNAAGLVGVNARKVPEQPVFIAAGTRSPAPA